MNHGGLVAYLVRQFREPSENLATSALHYVLDQSAACRESLRSVLVACGTPIHDDLLYRNQAWSDDSAIPDLVGGLPGEPPAVVIEGKFWAGLTDNQPTTYLRRLTVGAPGILLFVAPAQRFETLWPEVVARGCDDQIVVDTIAAQDELRSARLASGHVLAMASWRFLLERMTLAAQATGDAAIVSDIGQLISLCDTQDRNAFLPVHAEELSDLRFPRRLMDYNRLLSDALKRAVAAGHASTYKLATGGGAARTGYYHWIGRWMAFLTFDPQLWLEFGHGPLWLEFQDAVWLPGTPKSVYKTVAPDIGPLLEDLPRLPGGRPPMRIKADGKVVIPLLLPARDEREQVLVSLVDQMGRIAHALGGGPMPDASWGNEPVVASIDEVDV